MKNRPYKYILSEDKKTPLPANDLFSWSVWMENAENRRVAYTEVGDYDVSTVFLGLDHNFGSGGSPILFETMVFNRKTDLEMCVRSSTWEEAKKGHEQICAEMRKKEKDE